MDLDIIKEILTKKDEYYIGAKKTYRLENGTEKIGKDQIILFAIPPQIARNIKVNDIKLSEVEALNDCYIDNNIFLNNDYPPFQLGINFSKIYAVYPLTDVKKINKLMLEALKLESSKLDDYIDLIKKL